MNNIILKLGLSYLAGKLDGKKTYFGGAVMMLIGIGTIITGIVGIVGNMYADVGAPATDLDSAIKSMETGGAMFGAGLAAIGIGHKAEKILTAEPDPAVCQPVTTITTATQAERR